MTDPNASNNQDASAQNSGSRVRSILKDRIEFVWTAFRRVGAAIASLLALGSVFVVIFNYFSAYNLLTQIWRPSDAPNLEIMRSQEVAKTAQSTSSRILVLPFQSDAISDKGAELFADGITKDVIEGLSKFPTLRVLGHNTSAALKSQSGDLATLNQKYGITHVLSSTLRVVGDKFRLNVEIADTVTGATLWAQRYDRPNSDIVKISDDVVDAVVGRVASEVQRSDLQRSRHSAVRNISAYQLTLQARSLWQKPNRDTLPAAQQLLNRAIEADASYAPAYAYLAYTHLTSYNNTWSPGFAKSDTLIQMLANASKALELEPRYATAYAAQAIAYTYLGRHAEGQTAALEAVRLNGNDPDTLGRVGQVFSFSGEHEQAIQFLKKAIDLDPFGPAQWFNFLSRAYFFSEDYSAAIINARVCLERANIEPCRETLAAAHGLAQHVTEAAEAWKQISARQPNIQPEQIIARLRSAFKRQEDLDRLLRGLTQAAATSSK